MKTDAKVQPRFISCKLFLKKNFTSYEIEQVAHARRAGTNKTFRKGRLRVASGHPTLSLYKIEKILAGDGRVVGRIGRVVELRPESADGLHFFVHIRCDIDRKIGCHVTVLHVMIDRRGSPRLLQVTLLIAGLYLAQTCIKTCIGGHLGGPAVVRVAVVHRVAKDDLGRAGAKDSHNLCPVVRRVREQPVRDVEYSAKSRAQNPGCIFGLRFAQGSRPACPQLSLTQIQNTERMPEGRLVQQGACCAELDIVRVDANR